MNVRRMASATSILETIVIALSACSSTSVVSPDIVRDDESAARISVGMSRLGASPDRSDCFAEKIAAALSAPDANEAIRIIEASTSKEEMRSGVLGASTPVKQSFIRAHFGCSFFQ